jgi:hypothetical protein
MRFIGTGHPEWQMTLTFFERYATSSRCPANLGADGSFLISRI